MQTVRELFVHELSDMLDAEQRLVDALSESEEQTERPDLKKAFADHRAQTEKHVQRIEDVFQEMGLEPEAEQCRGIAGLIEERQAMMEERPQGVIADMISVGAAIKVERYEISSYEGLVRMAKELSLREAAKLLTQNLADEEAALKKMQALDKKLKPETAELEEEARPARRQPRTKKRRAA